MKLLQWFVGKRTYLLALALVAYAAGGYFTGHFNVSQALDLLFGAGFASALRAAINNQLPPTPPVQ